VRDAEKMLVGDVPADKDDEYLRDRTNFTLRVFLAYAKEMKPMMKSGVVLDKKYPFGI
jgi:hypothetical protein